LCCEGLCRDYSNFLLFTRISQNNTFINDQRTLKKKELIVIPTVTSSRRNSIL